MKNAKKEAKEARAAWRAALADGRVIEIKVAGDRTLVSYPTKEAAAAALAALLAAVPDGGMKVRCYQVSLAEQDKRSGLA